MFEIGKVIRIFAEDTIPPKVKYCIIVGSSSDEIATIFINTNIRPHSLGGELQGLQYPLSESDLKCLSHDSYADCSEIAVRKKGDLNSLLQKEPGRNEGNLLTTKMNAIVNLVKGAKTISPADKKRFGLI